MIAKMIPATFLYGHRNICRVFPQMFRGMPSSKKLKPSPLPVNRIRKNPQCGTASEILSGKQKYSH